MEGTEMRAFPVVAALALLAMAPAAWADTVDPRPILLMVGPGPINLMAGLGPVQMQGAPISGRPAGTSLVLKFNAGGMPPVTIPTEIVALSLQSVAPVPIGSSFFDVFVQVQPGPPNFAREYDL
jgi:hypothetical protein